MCMSCHTEPCRSFRHSRHCQNPNPYKINILDSESLTQKFFLVSSSCIEPLLDF